MKNISSILIILIAVVSLSTEFLTAKDSTHFMNNNKIKISDSVKYDEHIIKDSANSKSNDRNDFCYNFFTFDSLASIAALVTALIVFATLKEMKRQHKVSMTPYLSLAPTSFKISFLDDNRIEWISTIGNSSSDNFSNNSEKTEQTNLLNSTFLRIDNIGLGTAKSIRMNWDFDNKFENEFNTISSRYHNNHIKISRGLFQYPNSKLLSIYSPQNEFIQYLLSASVRNVSIRLNIPEPYMFLFFMHMRLIFDTEYSQQSKIPEYPSLKLCLEYEDIENKKINKSFSLTPVCLFKTRPVKNIKSLEITYNLKVEEISERVSVNNA